MLASLAVAAALVLPQVPGATSPAVRQATLRTTVCVPGYSTSVRPPRSYTSALKRRQLRQLGLPGTPGAYEEDHLVPLSLGGAPTSELNLWPEPWPQAHRTDLLEYRLWRAVCGGRLRLLVAQRQIVEWKRTHG